MTQRRGNLKEIVNSRSPGPSTTAAGRKQQRLDDPTVDIGALMRRALQAPKLRAGADETPNPTAASLQPSRTQQQAPKPAAPQPSLSLRSNPAFSPDDSLAKAASKLASLKAAGNGLIKAKAPSVTAAPPTAAEMAASTVPEPEISVSPRTSQPAKRRTAKDDSTTPGYNPNLGAHDDDVPLAARDKMTKRNRRKSVYQRPARYGDWWTGDDTELDQMVDEYNDDEEEEAAKAEEERQKRERAARVNRRKSAFPALGRSVAVEEDEPVAAAAAETKNADVGQQVRDMANELCAKLDGLIEPDASPKGQRKRFEDDKSLREKLLESWEGKSYYDRLKELSATPGRVAAGAKSPTKPEAADAQSKQNQVAKILETVKEQDVSQLIAAAVEATAPPPKQQQQQQPPSPMRPTAATKEPAAAKPQTAAATTAAPKAAPFNLKVEVPKQQRQAKEAEGPKMIGVSARGPKPGPAPWQTDDAVADGGKSSPGKTETNADAKQKNASSPSGKAYAAAIAKAEAVEQENQELRASLDSARNENQELQNELEAIKSQLASEKEATAALKHDLEKEQLLHEDECQRRDAAEKLVHELQGMLREAQGKGSAAEAQLSKFKQATSTVTDVEGRLSLAEAQASNLLEVAASLMEHIIKGKEEVTEALGVLNAALQPVEDGAAKETEDNEDGGQQKKRPRRKSTWR